MKKITLTQELLDATPPFGLICTGLAMDDEDGLFLANTNKELKWVAKKGAVGDWAVYAHFSSNSVDFVLNAGDKVQSKRNLEVILEFSDEVYSKYRH